jgi:hypothetical protein
VHWFQYADEPPGGRADGEDYNFGLVDVDDRPYEGLVAALRDSNRLAQHPASRHAAGLPASRHELTVPRADIDVASETLVDWPKAASLMPMKAGPAEVPFGDIHVAWDERGLFLATVSMDYYAPELLGAPAQFPRSEAFRIALGVDAGGGPRRVEIRVVPTEVQQTGQQETKLSFAAQVCHWQAGDGCAAVPGASARYFGTALDQPRVILKSFVPWSQLGLAGPPSRDALRLALGVTAFYRSKWMSLGGAMPDAAMAQPETWRTVRLGGDAAPDWLSRSAASTAAEGSN